MNPKIEFQNRWWIPLRKRSALSASVLVLCMAALNGIAQTQTVTNCTEEALRAATAGGGTVTFTCDGTITLGSTITINTDTVLDGSGHQITISGGNLVRVFEVASNVNFTLINLTIANGLSKNGYGGGIYNVGTLNVTNCHFVDNRAQGVQGADSQGGNLNGSPGQDGCGGAICNVGMMAINGSTFFGNSVLGGTGGYGYQSGGTWICGNGGVGGAGNGGAICNLGVVVVNGSTFAENSVFGGTGGHGGNGYQSIAPYNGGLGGTGGDGNGSALINGGSASLINCTFALNPAAGGTGGQGGQGSWGMTDTYPGGFGGRGGNGGSSFGVICDTNGQIYLKNCTLAFNSGTGGNGGAGGYGYQGSRGSNGSTGAAFNGLKTDGGQLINTILAGNSPSNCSGPIIDAGHNLSSDNSCAFTNVGSLNNTDPMLGPLADNGGPTLTMALLPGSPAIDAGDDSAAPPTDQRGVQRPLGKASDIGAYEYDPSTNPPQLNLVTDCTETALRWAMAIGGTVGFACDGTITVASPITVPLNVTLDATGHQIVISGGNSVRVFYVNSNVTFTAINLTIANGTSDSGAGIFNAGGIVNASNCVFPGNAAARGGAIYNSGKLIISRSMFTNNVAVGGPGAIGFPGLSREGGQDGENGGGGGWGGSGAGGALCNAGTARVLDSTFAFNSGTGGNGGGGGSGGGSYGGGGWGHGGSGGYGGSGGAGVGALFNSGDIQIINSTFAFNLGSAGSGGKGGAGGSGWIGGSGGNGGWGGSGVGAIDDESSSIYDESLCWITNCTFAENSGTSGTAGTGGTAGYSNHQSGSPGVPGSPGFGAGGIRTAGGILINTILGGNNPSNCLGIVTDAGHNISSDNSCAFTNVGSLNNTDPMIGPLADNGGPTLTMALLPGSPAIDAGDDTAAPPTDQRGFPRPFGAASDIGACEYTPPTWGMSLPSQTAETGSTVDFAVDAVGFPAPVFLYYFNGTNLVACGTNCWWELTNCDCSQSGTYTVVVTNVFGAVTSAPFMLNVIPSVERRQVPGIKMTGEAGSLLKVEYAGSLTPKPNWLPLDTVNLTNPPQYYFDLTKPLPPQRFYRAWQVGTPSVTPSLSLPGMVPAITFTGNIGDQLRLDCINAIGPTDAWVTLDTVTLTNASQLYFDTSAVGQPARLYRIVPEP